MVDTTVLRHYGRSLSALSESLIACAEDEAADKGHSGSNTKLFLWFIALCTAISTNHRKYYQTERRPDTGDLFVVGLPEALSRPNCAQLEFIGEDSEGRAMFELPPEVCFKLYTPELLAAAFSDWFHRGCEGDQDLARNLMNLATHEMKEDDPESVKVLAEMAAVAFNQHILELP